MRLIPRNTKVQTSFYKGITIADVILGLVGLGLAALAVDDDEHALFLGIGHVHHVVAGGQHRD